MHMYGITLCGEAPMAAQKTAFITGITGQVGILLTEFLLQKGYCVHGLVRWDTLDTTGRLQGPEFKNAPLHLHYGDMIDGGNLTSLIKAIKPDEIYNLAALSQVKVSFETPLSTLETNTKGTLNILEAVRILDMQNTVRIYQASSSEMFGTARAPQNENTPFEPCSPYGVAKLAAYWLARTYRDSYGIHVSNGILFNHESPLRGEDFVTRKIAAGVAAIEAGEQDELVLGNLDSLRDWGHARDYVEGMWMMLQQPQPGDYVLATGEAHSVRAFAEAAFAQTGVILQWSGTGAQETGRCKKTGRALVRIDPALYRPLEVRHLLGDARKARDVLGWTPKIFFAELVTEMVNAERAARWKGEASWRAAG